MVERRRVVVIFTGGTISMLPDPQTGAAMPALRGNEILARVPGLGDIAALEAIDWGLVPASHLRFSQILEIGALIETAAARDEVDGVVVVQGTDVLEETAFAWDLLHHAATAVVVVGAMRNAGQSDYDGPQNLSDGVRVAADPRLREQGVVVVMAGQILPADNVTKTHSQALDTFKALDDGALGSIAAGRVTMSRQRGPRRLLPATPGRADALVVLITAVVSTDGDLIRAALAGGATGLVVEATGAGNTDLDVLAAAREAMDAGVPVVLTTRCAAGDVGPYYGFPGGGASWADAGAIMAGTLSGPKARVALALGLGADLDRQALGALISL
ncbi:MAG: asparaginase [Chloroflexota bacterium]